MQKSSVIGIGVILFIFLAYLVYVSYLYFVKYTPVTTSLSAESVKIGFIGPLSGDAKQYGESIKNGIELAKKDLKSNTEIIYKDTECDGNKAAAAIRQLISDDKVVAVIGEVCSGATLAAAPTAEESKIILLSPSSTSPKISQAGDYIFRVAPSDALQGDFGAKLVWLRGYSTLAVLYSNEEYGMGFASVLKDSFEKVGGRVVSSESFEKEDLSVKTQLEKIKAQKPQALYIISNSPSSIVNALKTIRELKIPVALFGSEALKSDEIVHDAQGAAEGLIVTALGGGSPDFIERYKTEYATEPGLFAAQGYDAFATLYEALKGGFQNHPQLRDAVQRTSFTGVSGQIQFDKNGDIAGNYSSYQVKNGKFILLQPRVGN